MWRVSEGEMKDLEVEMAKEEEKEAEERGRKAEEEVNRKGGSKEEDSRKVDVTTKAQAG